MTSIDNDQLVVGTPAAAPTPSAVEKLADETKKAAMKGVSATPTDEPEPGTIEAAEPTPDAADSPKRKGGGFQTRIDKLTREREDARSYAAGLERQLRENRGPAPEEPVAPTSKAPQRPQEKDFSDWKAFDEAKEKYVSEHARWTVRQEIGQEAQRLQRESTARQEAETRQQAVTRFEKSATEISANFDGLEGAVDRFFNDPEMTISRTMAEYIMEVSERGPELVFALDADADLADRIAKMPPLRAARELAQLEAKLPQSTPRKVSNAPPPPKAVKGTAESPTKRLEDMSPGEYMAARRAAEKKAGTLKQNVVR